MRRSLLCTASAVALVAMALTSGCSNPQTLVGTWSLDSLETGAGAIQLPPPGRTRPKVTFEAPEADGTGKVSGFGGVNRFFGTYRAGGGSLALGALGATRMAGPNDLMTLEKQFLGVLQQAAKWKVEEGALHLEGSAGAATFTAAPEPPPKQAAPPPAAGE